MLKRPFLELVIDGATCWYGLNKKFVTSTPGFQEDIEQDNRFLHPVDNDSDEIYKVRPSIIYY